MRRCVNPKSQLRASHGHHAAIAASTTTEKKMKSYCTKTPRPAIALLAAGATVATLALALSPAQAPEQSTIAATAARPTEVAIVPSRIEVIGVRARDAARNDAVRATKAS
jgi:hypothetical protein